MNAEPTPTGSLELRDYVTTLRRQWPLLVLIPLLAVAAAAVWSLRQTPVYQSTASVLVTPLSANPAPPQGRPDQLINMTNEKQLALSAGVAELAGKRLRSPATPEELLRHVSAEVPAESQILAISYLDTVPLTAQRGADAFVKAYLDYRQDIVAKEVASKRKSLGSQIASLSADKRKQEAIAADPNASESARRNAEEVLALVNSELANLTQEVAALNRIDLSPGRVIQPAELPSGPASPSYLINLGAGAFVGLFLAIAVAFVRERSNDRLRDQGDLAERLDRPVLASIPKLSGWKRQPGRLGWSRRDRSDLVVLDEPTSPAAEAYRTLRTRVARLVAQLDINSLMVVSADVAEGKSTTAANLAVALAESHSNVLLVSADLRRPRVHQFFGLENRSGLANLLTDGTQKDAPGNGLRSQTAIEMWSLTSHLWAILSGPPIAHASSLMDSDAMKQFLKEQRDQFDIVILDCAPALVVADSLALAPLVDAVLVVADAKRSRRTAISQLREQLDHVGGRMIGGVLNRAPKSRATRSYYSYQDE